MILLVSCFCKGFGHFGVGGIFGTRTCQQQSINAAAEFFEVLRASTLDYLLYGNECGISGHRTYSYLPNKLYFPKPDDEMADMA